MTDTDIEQARRLVTQDVPKAVVARTLGCSRQVLYDALNSRGAYAPTSLVGVSLMDAQEV